MNAAHRRIRTSLLTATLLVLATVAAILLPTDSATAGGTPNLKIWQVVSGSSQSGHTFDTIHIKNNGTSGATHVNVDMFITTSGSFTGVGIAGPVTCEVMPAVPPYNYGIACQVSSSIAPGGAISFKFDFGGPAGGKFTNLMTVGDFNGDSNYKDNKSTLHSWFGIRADLAVAGTGKAGTTRGHATVVTNLVNRGPNNANNIQQTYEIKHASTVVVSGAVGSCQIIDPAAGYDLAAACVRPSLATGAVWHLSADIHGIHGTRLTVVVKVSSTTTDPNLANNKLTRTPLPD